MKGISTLSNEYSSGGARVFSKPTLVYVGVSSFCESTAVSKAQTAMPSQKANIQQSGTQQAVPSKRYAASGNQQTDCWCRMTEKHNSSECSSGGKVPKQKQCIQLLMADVKRC